MSRTDCYSNLQAVRGWQHPTKTTAATSALELCYRRMDVSMSYHLGSVRKNLEGPGAAEAKRVG